MLRGNVLLKSILIGNIKKEIYKMRLFDNFVMAIENNVVPHYRFTDDKLKWFIYPPTITDCIAILKQGVVPKKHLVVVAGYILERVVDFQFTVNRLRDVRDPFIKTTLDEKLSRFTQETRDAFSNMIVLEYWFDSIEHDVVLLNGDDDKLENLSMIVNIHLLYSVIRQDDNLKMFRTKYEKVYEDFVNKDKNYGGVFLNYNKT